MWYEETARCFQLAPDGRSAAYGPGPRTRIYDVGSEAVRPDAWPAAVDNARGAVFDSNGGVAVLGTVGGTNGWYSVNQGALMPLGIPPQALPRWEPRTSGLAYFTPGDTKITIEDGAVPRVVRLDGAVNGLAWAPRGDALFAITLHPNGLSSLSTLSPDGAVRVVRSDLDASPYFNALAITDDGGRVFLALAGETPPDPKARHDPDAPHRDLDIYALDLRSGQLRNVTSAPGDDFCPAIASGSLYWTRNDPAPQVVTLPLAGGEATVVADHGFLPRWRPDGRQIAFTRAYYRLSDYGLDMDGWIVDVDGNGESTSAPRSWIAGFGEDMGPVWSPNGRWVAYHSHRSATAVPLYESPGRTDDTWLMRASGGPEIRLTDFGFEVGPPDWAPDSRRLIFDSWDREGPPRFAKPWIVTIDPESGRSLRAAPLPLPPGVAGIWRGVVTTRRRHRAHRAHRRCAARVVGVARRRRRRAQADRVQELHDWRRRLDARCTRTALRRDGGRRSHADFCDRRRRRCAASDHARRCEHAASERLAGRALRRGLEDSVAQGASAYAVTGAMSMGIAVSERSASR
jgi:WD40-like Beta Propeller Repeat